jgi:hypothetical protein
MPIREEDYERVSWLPCPDCWSEKEYEQELKIEDFPNLDDPLPSPGYTVEAYKVEHNKWHRTFYGCTTCGGNGTCYKAPDDSIIGKSWYQWVVVEGGVILGTGMIPKRIYGYFGPGSNKYDSGAYW